MQGKRKRFGKGKWFKRMIREKLTGFRKFRTLRFEVFKKIY
jgi:hypothetical protein